MWFLLPLEEGAGASMGPDLTVEGADCLIGPLFLSIGRTPRLRCAWGSALGVEKRGGAKIATV